MANEICGNFKTKEEAVRAINILSLKGIPADKIKIFTSQADPKALAKETDGIIVHVKEDVTKRSGAKVKKIFSKVSECNMDLHDKLRKNGLSEKQAQKYTKAIKSGDILVIADTKLKMGHNIAIEEFSMEVPFVDHTKAQ